MPFQVVDIDGVTQAPGSSVPGRGVQVVGSDGAISRALLVDSSGRPLVTVATALPTGTNTIGRVQLRNPADSATIGDASNPVRVDPTGTTRQPVVLYDAAGNAVAIADGDTATSLTRGFPVAGITDGGVLKWLKLNAAGELIISQSSTPADPQLIFAAKCKNGSSPNMIVNGSLGSPIHFDVNADPTDDILLTELRMVFSCSQIVYNGASFGQSNTLTNGIKLDLTVNNGTTVTISTVTINENLSEFATVAGINLFSEFSGTNDHLVSSFSLVGGMRLKAGTSDKVRISIRDNLTATQNKYLQATVYGQKVI